MNGAAHPTPRGWTLVELLVALTLSLLIIAGIGQVYLAAKRSYEIQNSLARLQDVGRYVTELLTHEIHNAGYWGLVDISSVIPTGMYTPADSSCNTSDVTWGTMVKQKMFGFDHTQAPSGYACIDSDRSGGDVLTVRYGDPSTPTPYGGKGLYIRTTPSSGDIQQGPAGAVVSPPATDNELQAHVYYLISSSQAHQCELTSAPPLPALARESLTTSPSNAGKPKKEELVTGVEDLQFRFLVEDGTEHKYLDADDIAFGDWDKVKAVRFWVLIRDDCPDPSYTDSKTYNMGNRSYSPNDHYRRVLYTSTAALRN